MGQVEIMQLLKTHPGKWFTNKKIAEIINVSHSSASRCTARIIKYEPNIIENKEKVGNRGGCKTLFFRYKLTNRPVA